MKRFLTFAIWGSTALATSLAAPAGVAPLSSHHSLAPSSSSVQPLALPTTALSTAPQHRIFSTPHHYAYRLAVCVAPEVVERVFHGNRQQTQEWVDGLHRTLHDIYQRDLGIHLIPVHDDRLIVESNPDNLFFSYTHGTEIISSLIGEQQFDVGILIVENPYGEAIGMANVSGAYFRHSKGNAQSHAEYFTVAHELGHLFGAHHTHEGNNSIFTEPGKGQSIMSYGAPCNFFSLPSIQEIRTDLSHQDYFLDAERQPHRMVKGDSLTGNNPVHVLPGTPEQPQLHHARLRHTYTVTQGTRFQFHIPVAQQAPAGTHYAAHAFNLAAYYGHTKEPNLFMPTYAAQQQPCCMFQPYYDQPYNSFGTIQENLVPYSDHFKQGLFTFLLAAYSSGQYATHAVDLRVVQGEPFALTSNVRMEYDGGEPLALNWNPCRTLYGEHSQVRILLSEDFGQTYPHILADNVPNTGSWEGYIPFIPIGRTAYRNLKNPIRGGVIKVEVKGEAAYAVSHEIPYYIQGSEIIYSGGFTISGTGRYVRFHDAPPAFLTVASEADLPPMQPLEAYHKNSPHTTVTVDGVEERSGAIVRRTWYCKGINGSRPAAYTQVITLQAEQQAEEAAAQSRCQALNLQPLVADLLTHQGTVGYPQPQHPAMQEFVTRCAQVFDAQHQLLPQIDGKAVAALQASADALAALDVSALVQPQSGKYYQLANLQWLYGEERSYYATQHASSTACDLFTSSAAEATTWQCQQHDGMLQLTANGKPLTLQRFNDSGQAFHLQRGSTWGSFTLVNSSGEAARLNDRGDYLETYPFDVQAPQHFYFNTSYSSEFQFLLQDRPTDIIAPTPTEVSPHIFTPSGVRMSASSLKQLPKGLYIVNGKKITN